MEIDKDIFKNLIDYYIKNNKNELTQDLAEKYIKNKSSNFEYLLNYCEKFPEFNLDDNLIEIGIIGDSFNFFKIIQYYIKIDKNILTENLAKLAINDHVDNFILLLDYCRNFPNFHLDSILIENIIEKNYLYFHDLIIFYIETDKNELTENTIKLAIKYYSGNLKHLKNYCDKFPDFYINPKLVSKAINKYFINIAFWNNFTPEIVNNIKFDEIHILYCSHLTKDEFNTLLDNLKFFCKFGKIKNREKNIDLIFKKIYVLDDDIDLNLYKQEILDVMPMKKYARNI